MVTGESSPRIVYIDIAKGFGILLVVLGHSDLALVSPYLHQFIYSFHIPLFFFLSGYFFNPETPYSTFTLKRFRATLQPYLFSIILIYIASISFTNMSIGTALGRFVKSMYASGIYIEWIPLWFLPSLFITSLFSYIVYRLFLKRVRNLPLRWLLLLGLLAVGVFFIDAFYPFSINFLGKDYELYGLPYSLDIVIINSFFYMLGGEIRGLSLDEIFDNKWFLLLSGGALLALNAIFSQRADLAARIFESFPINTIEALLGISFTLALSKQISAMTSRLASALVFIGQASLYILIFHAPIQEYWGAKTYALTNLPAISILSAFIISTGISIGIYWLFFQKNPVALSWFGRTRSLSQKQEETAGHPQNVELQNQNKSWP